LAVIGRDDNEGIARKAEAGYRVEYLADVLVHIPNAIEVVVLVGAQLRFAQRLAWALNRRLRRKIVGAVAARQGEVPVLVVERGAGSTERRRANERGALAARVKEHDVVRVHDI